MKFLLNISSVQRRYFVYVMGFVCFLYSNAVAVETEEHKRLFFWGLTSVEQALRTDDEETKQKLLELAVASFREILVEEPEQLRVRLELARALFLQNKDDLAKVHFERVLANNPPPMVKANIIEFLNKIHDRRSFRGFYGFQVVKESNINSESDENTIVLHSLLFTKDDYEPKAETGITFTGVGIYRHSILDNVDFLTELGLSHTEFSGSEYDRTSFDFLPGFEYKLNNQTGLVLQGSFTSNFNNNSPNHKLGGRLRLQHEMNFRTNLEIKLDFGKRYYNSPEYSDHNSDEYELGFDVNHRLTPTLTLTGGISVARTHVKNNPDQSNKNLQLVAGISALLRSGYTLGFSVGNSNTSYKGQPGVLETKDGLARKDDLLILEASVLHRNLTIWGFSPQLALIHIKLKSNAQASKYKNILTQLNMVKQF